MLPRHILYALVLAFAALPGLTSARAADAIAVDGGWSRPTAAGVPVGVGYAKITNNADAEDVLTGGSADIAERVEVHETSVGDDGVTRMRKLAEVAIAPGATIELKPAGMHLMLMGLKAPLKEGDTFKVRLDFKNAGPIAAEFAVKAARGGEQPHHH